MSRALLRHSMFDAVLFPSESTVAQVSPKVLTLRKAMRHQVHPKQLLSQVPIVVFDLETTGLDSNVDEIIEIGAQKIYSGRVVGEISSLVRSDIPLSATVTKLTGITSSMLLGQPSLSEVLPRFLHFIAGSTLCAHNAAFDAGFISKGAASIGLDLEWPVFCTLKMARDLLPDLESKNLDSLAKHYELQFEARHRSIGDVKVTSAVLAEMLQNEGHHISQWADLEPYTVAMVS